MKLGALALALMTWGCVSTSKYEEDMASLRRDLNQEKTKLVKTQAVVCGQSMQLCAFILAVQAIGSGQEADAQAIQEACTTQARQCTKALAEPK